jgi:hypothetical protein
MKASGMMAQIALSLEATSAKWSHPIKHAAKEAKQRDLTSHTKVQRVSKGIALAGVQTSQPCSATTSADKNVKKLH